jgi:ligand-binding SRPBCC domain-containing protein
MKTHLLVSDLRLPATAEEAFALCSDITKLSDMTPPWLHLRMLSDTSHGLSLDAELEYRVRLHGVPFKWRGKITAWDPPHRFVDEQIRGPYRRWVHEHTFEQDGDGVICHDRVEYAHSGGWLVNRFLVRPDLDKIWAYRLQRIRSHLGGA